MKSLVALLFLAGANALRAQAPAAQPDPIIGDWRQHFAEANSHCRDCWPSHRELDRLRVFHNLLPVAVAQSLAHHENRKPDNLIEAIIHP